MSAATNLLHHGDNLPLLERLATEAAGTFDLIYIDPPFDTGQVWRVRRGAGRTHTEAALRPRLDAAYSDRFEPGAYLAMLRPRLAAMRELLGDEGSLYVQLGWRGVHGTSTGSATRGTRG
jgi:hypothetical protein